MATIAELQTKLTVDDTNFKRGIENSVNQVNGFSNKIKVGMAAAAAVITGAFVGAVKVLGDVMSEAERKASALVDTSTRLGAGIPELQRLQYAAQQSGISIDSINTAMGRMLRVSGAAAQGNKAASDSLARLGINAAEFVKLGVDQQYIAISNAIKQLPTAAEQAKAAVDIFGRGGIEQLSLLKDNVQGLVNEYKGLGIELTSNQAKSLEAYGDTVSKLGTVWDGFKNQLAAALAGPLKQLLDWIINSATEMGGLGNVAKVVASSVLGTVSGLIGMFGAIYRGIQSSIIAAEELLVILLRISQFSTLGLSNVLGGAGEKIDALKSDINQRSLNYLNSQNTQNKIQVEIKAAQGFIATVANSPENKAVINTTIDNQFSQAAGGIQ